MTRHTALNLAAAIATAFVASAATAATITVNSAGDDTLDDGTCTLREAIALASTNLASGASRRTPARRASATVGFAAGGGVHTIQPGSALPNVSEASTATRSPARRPTRCRSATMPCCSVQIDGSLGIGQVLDVTAENVTIRGGS